MTQPEVQTRARISPTWSAQAPGPSLLSTLPVLAFLDGVYNHLCSRLRRKALPGRLCRHLAATRHKKLRCAGASLLLGLFLCPGVGTAEAGQDPQQTRGETPPGFTDTPLLPDGAWRVHDAYRPRPRVVTPGTPSTQKQPGRPPSDAVVLFDGTDLSSWLAYGVGENQEEIVEPQWKVENGYVEVVPGTGDIFSKQRFGDCQIHVEWAAPSQIEGSSQGRGNSGVIIMGHYEIQVLDSFENLSYADGQAAAMYGQFPPLVNASREPGEWQTYDIIFEAPRFEGDELVKPAFATVFHNGVAVHHRQAFIGWMVYRKVATYTPHEPEGPLRLQSHGNPVRYRNIWVRPLGEYDAP